MPLVSHIDVEVRPSQNYQTVGFTARLTFDPAVPFEEAKFEADLAYSELEEIALKRVASLGERREASLPVSGGTPINGKEGVNPNDVNSWPTAFKPNNAGTFKYLPSSVISKRDFIDLATVKAQEMGIPISEITVFDDRDGAQGIESGGSQYSAGKIKIKQDSKLAAAMQGKTILASIDFVPGGDVKVALSRDGKSAMGAIQIAGQMANLEATPF
jgi:hypothetical protein